MTFNSRLVGVPYDSNSMGTHTWGPAGVPREAAVLESHRTPVFPGRHMFHPFNRPYPKPGQDRSDYDSQQLRKSSMRKTVDYNSSVVRMLEARRWQRDLRDHQFLQPDICHYPELVPPSCYLNIPNNAITTRFTKVATNKIRHPIFCLTWTPEGRRLITGSSSGEFTLWNGLTFNFETILQAHNSSVQSMVWSHDDIWMVTGDFEGHIIYWQSNMNLVQKFKAHGGPTRGVSFCPTDQKLASCSDDGTVGIWDFVRCQKEKTLCGHGADVKCVDWHPHKGIVVSGSRDNQQPVKLWDPKSGQSLATLHAHKNTVMDAKWNKNGQWLITASRDHLIKLFDIRRLDRTMQTFRSHKKEAICLSWHPFHEELFCSGGSDGAIFFWNVGVDKEVGCIDQAHESAIWDLAWHPIGHILCSGSNDHTSKFWTRNRPGDKMRDKYNLNTLPPSVMPEDAELLDDHTPAIPGMEPEDKVDIGSKATNSVSGLIVCQIPGLDTEPVVQESKPTKKIPYAKPIPPNFHAQWNEINAKNPVSRLSPSQPPLSPASGTKVASDDEEGYVLGVDPVAFAMEHLGRATLTLFGLPTTDPMEIREAAESAHSVPLAQLPPPTAVIVGGVILAIESGSEMEVAVRSGEEELLQKLGNMGLKKLLDEETARESERSTNLESKCGEESTEKNAFPRSLTPILDDSPNYRGHSEIGPTPTGGLSDFTYKRDFQLQVPPAPSPVGQGLAQSESGHAHHGSSTWQGPSSQEMGGWNRPPYEPQHQRGLQDQQSFGLGQPQSQMNRPFFAGSQQHQHQNMHPQHHQQKHPSNHQYDRRMGPLRGRSPMCPINPWGPPGLGIVNSNNEELRFTGLPGGGMNETRAPTPSKGGDEDMRRIGGGYPHPNERNRENFSGNNFLDASYECNWDDRDSRGNDYGGRPQHYQNYPQHSQQYHHRGWNQGGMADHHYGRSGGFGGRRGHRGRRGGDGGGGRDGKGYSS